MVEITSTCALQVPFVVPLRAGILAPVGLPNVNVLPPGVGFQVGAPPQVVLAAGVSATCKPTGKISVNVTPVNGTLFSLVKAKVNVETPLTATGLGLKALVMEGDCGTPHPVKITSSIKNCSVFLFAPEA